MRAANGSTVRDDADDAPSAYEPFEYAANECILSHVRDECRVSAHDGILYATDWGRVSTHDGILYAAKRR